MPESDVHRGVSRRAVLYGAGALVPGLLLNVDGTVAVAAAADLDGGFSAQAYAWRPAEPGGVPATGVEFTLLADGRPMAGRVRFSISSADAVNRSVWFETVDGLKQPRRHGYVDLELDGRGGVRLDDRLRVGPVPTGDTGADPVLRAQLVGSEVLLAVAHLSVAEPLNRRAAPPQDRRVAGPLNRRAAR
ncbi:MAG: hypothetical protein HOU81_23815 [Hamadaea sp.]|uniref:hypothetical protein n=1 Tax=Hamadaea sp. TaxID=2024425 RepID=UPI0017F2C626|nr:hypothetical protein [Hamadaea sp.]NUR73851.1 hypothetical protein [Hamadaea sp.]NUT18984.1 hypothetical protein [Hamadaea sp.]